MPEQFSQKRMERNAHSLRHQHVQKTSSGIKLITGYLPSQADPEQRQKVYRLKRQKSVVEVTQEQMDQFLEQQNELKKHPIRELRKDPGYKVKSFREKKAAKTDAVNLNEARLIDEKKRGSLFFDLMEVQQQLRDEACDPVANLSEQLKAQPENQDLSPDELQIKAMDRLSDDSTPEFKAMDALNQVRIQETDKLMELDQITEKSKTYWNAVNHKFTPTEAVKMYTEDRYYKFMHAYMRHPREYDHMPLKTILETSAPKNMRLYSKQDLEAHRVIAKFVAPLAQRCVNRGKADTSTVVLRGASKSWLMESLGKKDPAGFEKAMEEMDSVEKCKNRECILKDDSFVSTAYAPGRKFALNEDREIHMCIKVSQGTRSLHISGTQLQAYANEYELLLAPGTPMRILRTQKQQSGIWKIYAETIPDNQQEIRG